MIQDDAIIGTTAALVNQEVLVMVYGICKSLADVALATIGVKITGGAVVAGRVSTTGAAAGNFAGVTVSAQGTIGSPLKVFVGSAH